MQAARSKFEQYWNQKFRGFALACDDDAGISGWHTTGLATRLRHFGDYWTPNVPESLWLDAGCGAGTYTRFLAQHGLRVVGLDYSHLSVTKARLRDQLGALWAVADLNHLPISPNRFRGVLCFGVTQTLESPRRVLQELVTVTADGGEVWVDALNSFCIATIFMELLRALRRRPRHLRYENPWRLRSLVNGSGFCDVQLFWLPILPGRWQRFQWILETHRMRRFLAMVPPVGALLSHSFLLRGYKRVEQD